MKQIIFKGKFGWYILANNYKDKTDVAYVNLFFPKDSEPLGEEKTHKWIDITSCAFTSFKGKIGLTIFAYDETESPKKASENLASKVDEFINDNNISLVDVEQDNLPFY